MIERVPPDNRTVYIETPCIGKVSMTALPNALPSGDYEIPDGSLFIVKHYPDGNGQNLSIDPFRQLREACLALENLKKLLPAEQPVTADAPSGGMALIGIMLLIVVIFILAIASISQR